MSTLATQPCLYVQQSLPFSPSFTRMLTRSRRSAIVPTAARSLADCTATTCVYTSHHQPPQTVLSTSRAISKAQRITDFYLTNTDCGPKRELQGHRSVPPRVLFPWLDSADVMCKQATPNPSARPPTPASRLPATSALTVVIYTYSPLPPCPPYPRSPTDNPASPSIPQTNSPLPPHRNDRLPLGRHLRRRVRHAHHQGGRHG